MPGGKRKIRKKKGGFIMIEFIKVGDKVYYFANGALIGFCGADDKEGMVVLKKKAAEYLNDQR